MREINENVHSQAAALDTGESCMLAKYLGRKTGVFLSKSPLKSACFAPQVF
jgi:hypothetical protein